MISNSRVDRCAKEAINKVRRKLNKDNNLQELPKEIDQRARKSTL